MTSALSTSRVASGASVSLPSRCSAASSSHAASHIGYKREHLVEVGELLLGGEFLGVANDREGPHQRSAWRLLCGALPTAVSRRSISRSVIFLPVFGSSSVPT